jgi:hypothetical protein
VANDLDLSDIVPGPQMQVEAIDQDFQGVAKP